MNKICCYCEKSKPENEMTEVETDIIDVDEQGNLVRIFSCWQCLYGSKNSNPEVKLWTPDEDDSDENISRKI